MEGENTFCDANVDEETGDISVCLINRYDGIHADKWFTAVSQGEGEDDV